MLKKQNNMELSEEKEMINQAKRNPEAFGLLYDKYYQPIFGYILRRTADIELTQDLTSETFFKALKYLGRFKWKNIPFSAWLYRIAINEVNGFYRKRKKLTGTSLSDLPEIPDENDLAEDIKTAEKELERKKEFIKVRQKILELKPFYQTVITMRFFEKKKTVEISQILGKSEGTIKSQIHRALKELKRLMTI